MVTGREYAELPRDEYLKLPFEQRCAFMWIYELNPFRPDALTEEQQIDTRRIVAQRIGQDKLMVIEQQADEVTFATLLYSALMDYFKAERRKTERKPLQQQNTLF